MKKILAIFILLAIMVGLVACGAKESEVPESSQNTTGSVVPGSDNIDTEAPANNESVDSETDFEKPSTATCEMEYRDGVYIYSAFGEEFVCKTNIWDFINAEKYEIDWYGLLIQIGYVDGYYRYEAGGAKKYVSVALLKGNPAGLSISGSVYNCTIEYSSDAHPECSYAMPDNFNFVLSEEELIVFTYALEHLIESPDKAPLEEHQIRTRGDLESGGRYLLP